MQCLLFGSPTAELFAASYNNRSNKSNTITLELGIQGYKQYTIRDWLKPEDNHGIYNKGISYNWWLASPHNLSENELRVCGPGGYFDDRGVTNNSYSVCPVVCIPTSVFNSKYGTNLVDE